MTCPYCLNDGLFDFPFHEVEEGGGYAITCSYCGHHTDHYPTIEEARKEWSTPNTLRRLHEVREVREND